MPELRRFLDQQNGFEPYSSLQQQPRPISTQQHLPEPYSSLPVIQQQNGFFNHNPTGAMNSYGSYNVTSKTGLPLQTSAYSYDSHHGSYNRNSFDTQNGSNSRKSFDTLNGSNSHNSFSVQNGSNVYNYGTNGVHQNATNNQRGQNGRNYDKIGVRENALSVRENNMSMREHNKNKFRIDSSFIEYKSAKGECWYFYLSLKRV